MSDKLEGRGKSVRVRRLLPATAEEVFDAWADAGSLKFWLCPGATTVPSAEVDFQVGGSFRIVMSDGEREYVHTGRYREIRRPERLVFTWSSPATGDRSTLVTVTLQARGAQTELVLVHEGLLDERAVEDHEAGWSSIIEKLDSQLR